MKMNADLSFAKAIGSFTSVGAGVLRRQFIQDESPTGPPPHPFIYWLTILVKKLYPIYSYNYYHYYWSNNDNEKRVEIYLMAHQYFFFKFPFIVFLLSDNHMK